MYQIYILAKSILNSHLLAQRVFSVTMSKKNTHWSDNIMGFNIAELFVMKL